METAQAQQMEEELKECIITGKHLRARELTEKLLKEGVSAKEILDRALLPGMDEVGEKFKRNEYYVPEMLVAARAMEAAMEALRPELTESGVEPVATFVIGTVRGDLHDIGKNLVAMMMEGAGFRVIDLGIDVPPERFVEEVQKSNAQIMGMSALLTTTMPAMKETIEVLKQASIREKVKIMVGGAPITQEYADEIEADGYAPDAASAVDKARELLGIVK